MTETYRIERRQSNGSWTSDRAEVESLSGAIDEMRELPRGVYRIVRTSDNRSIHRERVA